MDFAVLEGTTANRTNELKTIKTDKQIAMKKDKKTLNRHTEILPQMKGEVVLYQSTENVRIEARLVYETIWLTQKQIADLFGTKRLAII